jgi:hypothetical protein
MRNALLIALVAALALTSVPAFAELQNVTVGGDIRIRGSWYIDAFDSGNVVNMGQTRLRWPGAFLPRRAIGAANVVSNFAWDDRANSLSFVEQRTKLNVRADFTNEVSAFIELDSYDVWGEDFRSDYVTGQDLRPVITGGNAEVEVYQGYIQANNMWGVPLMARIGRQEIQLGSGWLVGPADTSSLFRGTSFDAITLAYDADMFGVTALWSKLAETSPVEQDGDVDMYGLYASYKGLEDICIDGYLLYVRDGRQVPEDFAGIGGLAGWWNEVVVEPLWGVDDYDPTELYTIGLRGAGTIGAFDFEAEVAYQFGDADRVGNLFNNNVPVLVTPFGPIVNAWLLNASYGDDGAEYDEWAANAEVGYTFDMKYTPRVYLGGAYFGGEDQRDISWAQWRFPYLTGLYKADASVSFNRMFSNWEYSEFLDGTDLSNAYVIRGGVSAMPTESVELLLAVSYFSSLEEFDAPRYITLGNWKVPLFPNRSYWTQESDAELGWEVGLYATYNYTEDLVFEVGYAHLFLGDGLEDGNFSNGNGLWFNGGTGDEDADYVYFETRLSF